MRQIQTDGARARPLAYHDIDLEVLHGRIEDLFDGAVETMYLVNEQDIPLAQRGQDGRHIRLAFECRTRCGGDGYSHLVGDDGCQCGLPKPGRPR